jgi:hypothetical protein
MKLDIWYMNTKYFRNGIMGFEWLKTKNLLPKANDLPATHVLLKSIEVEGDDVFAAMEQTYTRMQAEYWSPRGEAKKLIMDKKLGHTSMMVGDVFVHNNDAYIVDSVGFTKLD